MSTSSRYLSARQFRGLEKLGDAYCPGDDELPSFAALGCAEHVDEVLDCMPEQDRRDLAMLLGVCAIKPRWALSAFIRLLALSPRIPSWLGGGMLRFLHMGIRGLILTLYYSGKAGSAYRGRTPHEVLGYEVSVYTADVDEAERGASDVAASTAQASDERAS